MDRGLTFRYTKLHPRLAQPRKGFCLPIHAINFPKSVDTKENKNEKEMKKDF